MELLKETDGLGIQVSGGRGSKRSPHAIVVTQVKEGGAAHRWLDNSPIPLPLSSSSPFPLVLGASAFHLIKAHLWESRGETGKSGSNWTHLWAQEVAH